MNSTVLPDPRSRRYTKNFHCNFITINNAFESLDARLRREREQELIERKLEQELLQKFKMHIRRNSINMNLQDINKLSQNFKNEYVNMVIEKGGDADQKVQNSRSAVQNKKKRMMSILYNLEAPVKTWKKGLKRLDTAIEIKKQEDRDYHL